MSLAVPQSVQSLSVAGRTRLGRVVANTGQELLVMIDSDDAARSSTRVGDIVVITVKGAAAVGLVSGMNEPAPGLDGESADLWMAQVELVGTLGLTLNVPTFTRSVSVGPTLGDVVYCATPMDLRRLFRNGDEKAYPVGVILGQDEVAATVDGDLLVDGGMAVLGNSGSGKSCTLASLVRAILRHRHSAGIVLIDPCNEYSRSFGKAAVCIAPEPGLIPYWVLSFKELQWVLSRSGGPLDTDERSLLEEAIPEARKRFGVRNTRQPAAGEDQAPFTVETPVPYRIFDVLNHLDKLAQDDGPESEPVLRRLRTRIKSAVADPRFALFFGENAAADNLGALMRRLFRLDARSAPMSVLQFAQLSAGVDRVAVAVVCRLATALAEWGEGRRRTLLLIEDIGRYAPARPMDEASKLSLDAIRLMGGRPRKLGTTIGVVGNDAREIHGDVMAQCATYFVHRLTSQAEIEAVHDFLPEAASTFLGGAPTLGVGETIGLGQGVPLAGRISISTLPEAAIPGEHRSPDAAAAAEEVDAIIQRWREYGTGEWAAPPPPVV